MQETYPILSRSWVPLVSGGAPGVPRRAPGELLGLAGEEKLKRTASERNVDRKEERGEGI